MASPPLSSPNVDRGQPISYRVLERGTPIYSRDGEKIGTVAHVLAADDKDVFDGIVVAEHLGLGGHRFADADDIDSIYERAVVLKLDHAAAEHLPEPSENPAVLRDDPAESATNPLADKLRRAWDYLSGNY